MSFMSPKFYFSGENTFSALNDVEGDVYHFRLYFITLLMVLPKFGS